MPRHAKIRKGVKVFKGMPRCKIRKGAKVFKGMPRCKIRKGMKVCQGMPRSAKVRRYAKACQSAEVCKVC
ncbi:hypothetical protein D5F53_25695 [Paenibacillus lautus]|uniref:Uncharacterized protein n=1 Tax=Paenibacillus lautus TaxID=1401 RepID=A0A385TTN3_PAELA|nr:hypothetical protein D5F53_25695 [Paenibacillus lautus]